MKKFFISIFCLLALAAGGYWAVFYGGLYLNLGKNDTPSLPFRTLGAQLQAEEDGAYTNLTLRGVDVTASMPANYATAYAPEEADYLRWFEAIGQMGANAIRVVTIMDDDFYNALYTYNTSHDQPLYLLQGTSVPDAAGNGAKDAYSDDFLGGLVRDGKALVDVIHGRKALNPSHLQGSGTYRRDVSPWVVGFLVGTDWYPDTVAYTDHSVIRDRTFTGIYFQTTPEATPFEAMLAQVMEEITAYETEKYNAQRPVGILSDPACDFLEYEDIYARQLGKYAFLDPERITPTQAMEAGRFAAYRLYDFCPDFTQYLSQAQQTALAAILADLDTSQIYGGYLDLLSRYHTMPVVAAGYGYSSARGALKIDQPPLTEREQGEALSRVSLTLESTGWAGGFISTWQDVWERRSWNTAFATVPTNNYLWHDLQTDGQSYGLMAFQPGQEDVCLLDGDPGEWTPEDLVLENGDLRVSARYDAQGLYLLVEGVDPATPVYLPLDLSDEVGSRLCRAPALSFARAADFLLCLDGTDRSRLLVQERYDAMRENFLFEVSARDPFVSYPDKDSGWFTPIRMALDNDLLVDVITPESRTLQRLGTWETGRLTHGNGDPDAPDYLSLADFRFGDGCAEIRLPWLLLNVGDPSDMAVHRDYYEHYGVEMESIRELWIGAARMGDQAEIPMASFSLKGWNTSLSYRERLKESYTVIQALWKGGEDHALDH